MPERIHRPATRAVPAAPPTRGTSTAGGAVEEIPGARRAGAGDRVRSLFGRRVSRKAMTQWTMQLSTLLGAGLPLVRSLRILEGQMPAGPFRDVLRKVSEDVEGGESLSESFARHPGVFDRLTVHMARAGEAGGILDQILARLAGFLERSERLRGRVVGALLYPAVVLAVAGLVLVLVLTFLVPKFREIFKQFGQELPPITQALLALSNFLQSWWWALLLGLVGLAVLGRIFVRMPGGRAVADRARLSMPLFGPLVRGTLVARFARTLGTLLQSGVPILDALQIVRGSVPNATLERALDGVSASVREGEGIAPALGRSGVFDDLVVNMIAVGEETGELDRMLLKIADIFEEQVDQRVQNLFRVLEPVILVALAVVVGLVVFAIFLPLVQLLEALHG